MPFLVTTYIVILLDSIFIIGDDMPNLLVKLPESRVLSINPSLALNRNCTVVMIGVLLITILNRKEG